MAPNPNDSVKQSTLLTDTTLNPNVVSLLGTTQNPSVASLVPRQIRTSFANRHHAKLNDGVYKPVAPLTDTTLNPNVVSSRAARIAR